MALNYYHQSPNEPSTRTSADGSFSLQSAIPSAGFVAIAVRLKSTTDTFTKVQSLVLKAPAGATVVTPATTLFVEVKEKNGHAEIKTTDLASALGLKDINILEFNPFSSGADPDKALTAEKVSSQINTRLQYQQLVKVLGLHKRLHIKKAWRLNILIFQ